MASILTKQPEMTEKRGVSKPKMKKIVGNKSNYDKKFKLSSTLSSRHWNMGRNGEELNCWLVIGTFNHVRRHDALSI